jgi:DNA-binding MarR family transcriptional regulator
LAQAVPLTHLAEFLALDRTTLARNLKPLESQGMVVVEAGEDKRVRLIRLTEYGRQLLQLALPCWRKAQDELLARLGPSQQRAVYTHLQDLAAQVP